MSPGVLDLQARVVFFPVRHHSPACARSLRQLIREVRPSQVLIEGPSDFNPRLSELYLEHQLPVAIYSWVRDGEDNRRGAFYPFCLYSPEWQALLAARKVGAKAAFIDRPWADILSQAAVPTKEDAPAPPPPTHRYAEPELRHSPYVAALSRKLGVEDMDALWDLLFEIEPLDVQTLFTRVHHFCYGTRAEERPSEENLSREAYMSERIKGALSETAGRVIVVTGGYHSYALYCRLHNLPFDHSERDATPHEAPAGLERGMALTPYSYERLDALRGYEAGMPNPGFYDRVWHAREYALGQNNAPPSVHRVLLAQTVKHLRRQKQTASSADLIAALTTSEALAALRGHYEPWRRDLVDGILGALVKDELSTLGTHPFLGAIHEVLRGDERGRLSTDAPVPPLVQDLRATLARLELEPERRERGVNLDLTQPRDLERSRVLHRLRVLGIKGYDKTGGNDFIVRDDMTRATETWRLQWSPEGEASAIEASIYGPTLAEAATARLVERTKRHERDAEAAALTLLDAALMGLAAVTAAHFTPLQELIRGESDFFRLARALDHLLFLHQFDWVLGTTGLPQIGALLGEAWERGVWLLETLGSPQGVDKDLLHGVGALLRVCERCADALQLNRANFVLALRRIGASASHGPILRGACLGALWSLDEATADDALTLLPAFSDPQHLGDFLTGLFSLAREAVQRQPDLVTAIDTVLCNYDDASFLAALPALRLAFSFFTPREKHYLARTLLDQTTPDAAPLPDLQVPVEVAARVLDFDSRLYAALKRYGLRGGLKTSD